MSMSDTAEYWKHKGKNNFHIPFIHIPKIDCGHYHVHESSDIDKIDCHACKNILKEDLILVGLLEFENEKDVLKERKQKENRQKQIIENNKKKSLLSQKHGICNCGNIFTKRMNKKTGEYFLGCEGYPKCKETKPLNK